MRRGHRPAGSCTRRDTARVGGGAVSAPGRIVLSVFGLASGWGWGRPLRALGNLIDGPSLATAVAVPADRGTIRSGSKDGAVTVVRPRVRASMSRRGAADPWASDTPEYANTTARGFNWLFHVRWGSKRLGQ